MWISRVRVAVGALVAAAVLLGSGVVAAGPVAVAAAPGSAVAARPGWAWPVSPAVVVAPYRSPAHRYGAGHRGIDLEAPVASEVRSPADGVIVFAGVVVDRPLVTIDHGDGLVTTLEPVRASLPPGTSVARGTVIGTVDLGGHAAADTVHFGVRLDGEYVNPLLLYGSVPRAVLLPCC